MSDNLRPQFLILIRKFIADEATVEEQETLFRYYALFADEPDVFEGMSHKEVEALEARLEKRINTRISELQRPVLPFYRRYSRFAAAAVIVIILSASFYFYLKPRETQQVAQLNPEQIAPLQKGVVLTMGQGKQVQLVNNHTGRIASTGQVQIDQADSALHYTANAAVAAEPEMNTLTNKGNTKFSVQLADGSAVTLDIGSSLSYPSSFQSAVREVSLTGQGYFKIKHVPGKRFLVKARGQETEDIGTEFNINAYEDEPTIRTTLLEGSIKVNERTLKPGEQAVVNGGRLKVKKADIEEVTAWLQDKIVLEQQTLESILRKVARIYGVQVVYLDQDVKAYTYGGAVNTSTKLSAVLNFLRKAGGVDFKVEGKVVQVFKKKK